MQWLKMSIMSWVLLYYRFILLSGGIPPAELSTATVHTSPSPVTRGYLHGKDKEYLHGRVIFVQICFVNRREKKVSNKQQKWDVKHSIVLSHFLLQAYVCFLKKCFYTHSPNTYKLESYKNTVSYVNSKESWLKFWMKFYLYLHQYLSSH